MPPALTAIMQSYSTYTPRSSRSIEYCTSFTVSVWPMTIRDGSTPSCVRMSICVPPVGNVGACVVTMTPVRAAARPEARNERSSRAVM